MKRSTTWLNRADSHKMLDKAAARLQPILDECGPFVTTLALAAMLQVASDADPEIVAFGVSLQKLVMTTQGSPPVSLVEKG